jgi:hypothetical protein
VTVAVRQKAFLLDERCQPKLSSVALIAGRDQVAHLDEGTVPSEVDTWQPGRKDTAQELHTEDSWPRMTLDPLAQFLEPP